MEFLRRLWRNIIDAREEQARLEVARMLKRTEFRKDSVEYIAEMLKTGNYMK